MEIKPPNPGRSLLRKGGKWNAGDHQGFLPEAFRRLEGPKPSARLDRLDAQPPIPDTETLISGTGGCATIQKTTGFMTAYTQRECAGTAYDWSCQHTPCSTLNYCA
ncbi:unnamed protein product, partial [Mesorhabditis spiculigera]